MFQLCYIIYKQNHIKCYSIKMTPTVNIRCVCITSILLLFANVCGKREMVQHLNKYEQCFGFGGGTRIEVIV